MKAALFLIAMVAACATPAFATIASDLAAIEARRKACEATDPSGSGLTDCAYAAKSQADKLLARLYKSIVAARSAAQPGDPDAAANKEELKRLLASQKAWVAYRQAECDLQGVGMLGGSREGLIIGGCLYSLTAQRVKDLDGLLGGDGVR